VAVPWSSGAVPLEATVRGGEEAGASGLETPGAAGTGAYEPLGRLAVPGAAECVVGDGGTTAFVAVDDGFATVDVGDPAAPRPLTRVTDVAADREDGPLTSILDVKLEDDRLLVSGPAQSGDLQGLVVYDVSDPADPVPATEFYHTGFDVHNADLADGYAYLTNNRPLWPPLVVVDVDRESPREVGRYSPETFDPPDADGWQELPGLTWPLHDVTVQGDYAYCCYWDAGTWILDVSDPSTPSLVTRIGPYEPAELVEMATQSGGGDLWEQSQETPGNDHSAALSGDGDLLAVGEEAWDVEDFDGGGPGGVRLYDVSSEAEPRRLARIEPPTVEDAGHRGTWVTAHNVDLHGDRLYSAWYQAGVKVHDVSDPADPRVLAWWRDPDAAAFWTAQHATGEAFVATSYHRHAGLDEALYAFPNEPGRQADPPPSMPGGPTTTEDDTPGTDDPGTSATGDATGTPGTGPTGRDGTPEDGTTGRETPGFGLVAAALGLGAGLEAWRRYRGLEK